jgi:hypothetical protein
VLDPRGQAPTDDEGRSLAEAFNLADAWITMQNTTSLMKAVDYVERELVKKGHLEGEYRRTIGKVIESLCLYCAGPSLRHVRNMTTFFGHAVN